jgi:hypothetical protein
VAADLAAFLRDKGKHEVSIAAQVVDQRGFVIAPKGVGNDSPDGLVM